MKKERPINNGQREFDLGYREGLRQGKARERARLRRIWDAQGMETMCRDLVGRSKK